MKSLTGQYECVHRSGVGLDYFTSRIDRLTLQANGRCISIVQERSRIGHAARSLLNEQQIDTNAPETRREGSYSSIGTAVTFSFDDGTQAQGQATATGLQIGSDVYEKVSDSTFLPPTHRLKSSMEDIARGAKIASALGGAAVKAVKAIQDTIQSSQEPQATPAQPTYPSPAASPQQDDETLFCDQCGAPVRPGKRFCNRCGAKL